MYQLVFSSAILGLQYHLTPKTNISGARQARLPGPPNLQINLDFDVRSYHQKFCPSISGLASLETIDESPFKSCPSTCFPSIRRIALATYLSSAPSIQYKMEAIVKHASFHTSLKHILFLSKSRYRFVAHNRSFLVFEYDQDVVPCCFQLTDSNSSPKHPTFNSYHCCGQRYFRRSIVGTS